MIGIFTLIYIILFFFGIFFVMIFIIMHHRNIHELYSSPNIKNYRPISILIPAYNEEDTIGDTIISVMRLEYPENKKEVIVLNDGSKDNTLKICERLKKKYKTLIILNKPNSGKARSLNEGIALAKGELIAVVDADSYPMSDGLKKMVGYFEDENVAAVTSRVLVKNKNNWLSKFQVLDYSIIAWTRKLLDFVDSVYVTNGPLSIYRKKVLIEVGGFDHTNLTEDIEVTWHILSKGYNTRMSYSAIVYTSVPEDFKTWIRQRVRWNLGGLQTVGKYWKTMFKKGSFGFFVIPYVSASFILALIGFLLLVRFYYIKGTYQIVSLYYAMQGYPYWEYFEFRIYLTLLLFLATIFFVLAIYYYKIGFKNSETGNKSIIKILAYSFFYRSLYTIPLIIALYKLARGDIRWYTK